jgi:hypothetical protein
LTEFRYVGSHADTLANGRPVEPGEFVKLSDEEAEANQGLIDDGHLTKVEGKSSKSKSKGEEE